MADWHPTNKVTAAPAVYAIVPVFAVTRTVARKRVLACASTAEALPVALIRASLPRSTTQLTTGIDRRRFLVLVPAVKSTVPAAQSDDHSLFICQPN